MTVAPPHPSIPTEGLRAQVRGRVLAPTDPGYEDARAVFYGGFDHRPAVIVRPTDADDVARVVSFARDGDHVLAVRSGGHSLAGHSAPEGGLVLDLRDLTRLEIDADNRTAWAETGLTAADYTAATAARGLATGFGDTGSVGIGGITLSGGIGFLVRKHGLTIDNLLAAEVVTADGRILQTDETSHPDLFWALRGGGGNFGVATRLRFRLHPIGEVVGGMLILPASPELLVRCMALAEDAPEELSAIVAVMPAPPAPLVPEEHHGRLVLVALLAYAGSAPDAGSTVAGSAASAGAAASGEAAVAPFRALAPPIVDTVRPMRLPDLYRVGGEDLGGDDDDEEYHPTAVAHTMFMDAVDEGAAETIFAYLENADAPMRAAQLRVLGGAMARVPIDATAFAHRASRIMTNVAAFYDTPDERADRQAWVADFGTALRQSDSGAYAGFLADEGEARVRQAYPDPTWERLAAIKAVYDPTNLFRLNQNIPPRVDHE